MITTLYPALINTRRTYKIGKWYCMIETPVWNEYGAIYIKYKKYNYWHTVAVLHDAALEPVVFNYLIAALQASSDEQFDTIEQIENYINKLKVDICVEKRKNNSQNQKQN